MKVAVYPGSFDPVTNGHLDVVRRAAAVFDRLIVAILENPSKSPLLDTPERLAAIHEALDEGGLGDVEVDTFQGLTVEFCRRREARFLVRGLRGGRDLEAEMQLALNNRHLAPEIDTVFFLTSHDHAFVSSSLVREISRFGGDVSGMVPAAALRRLPKPAGSPVP